MLRVVPIVPLCIVDMIQKRRTLKAKFNVLGNRMYPKLCADLQVAYRQAGAYVVAFDSSRKRFLSV